MKEDKIQNGTSFHSIQIHYIVYIPLYEEGGLP